MQRQAKLGIGFVAILLSNSGATSAFAQLPPIMNPPNAEWHLWTCMGTSTYNGQQSICGQGYGYNDYLARYNCGPTYRDIYCYPTA